MRPPLILFDGRYSVDLCRQYPTLLFVFGDNGDRRGNGGQAVIRGEPNTLGVATLPHLGVPAVDGDPHMMHLLADDLCTVETRIVACNKRVVLPVGKDGRIALGTGIANLPYNAPLLYMMLERWFERLKRQYL